MRGALPTTGGLCPRQESASGSVDPVDLGVSTNRAHKWKLGFLHFGQLVMPMAAFVSLFSDVRRAGAWLGYLPAPSQEARRGHGCGLCGVAIRAAAGAGARGGRAWSSVEKTSEHSGNHHK